MSMDLATMQTHIREMILSRNFDATTAQEINRINRHLMNMALLHKWPDFRRTDTTIDTVAETEAYASPTALIFYDITQIEMQDPYDDTKWKTIPPVRNETNWSRAGRREIGFPEMHLLQDSGSAKQIAFRPVPDFAGTNNVRVTGYVQPTEVASGTPTPFRDRTLDFVLVELVSADILDERVANRARGQTLFEKARLTLSKLAGREIKPSELAVDGNR